MLYQAYLEDGGYRIDRRLVAERSAYGRERFFFNKRPEDKLSLVRVIGLSREPASGHDTIWNVQLFSDATQARALADKIDFTYDLFRAFQTKSGSTQFALSDAPPERIAEVDKLVKLYQTMPYEEWSGWHREHVEWIEYAFEAIDLKLCPQWQSEFAQMNYVEVIEVAPLPDEPVRWRKRW